MSESSRSVEVPSFLAHDNKANLVHNRQVKITAPIYSIPPKTLEDEMEAAYSKEADDFGINDAVKKRGYIEKKVWETFDAANRIGERDEKLHDSLYDGKLKESKVYAAGPGRAALLTVLNDAVRDKLGVAVIGLDLDNFKKANTEFGHLGADDLLRAIARAARNTTKRKSDIIIRFGGEEIFIVLKGLKEEALKNKMAELAKNYEAIQDPFLLTDDIPLDEPAQAELRQKSGLLRFPRLREIQTASLGGTYFDPHNPRFAGKANGELADQLLAEADDAINASKGLGKNQANVYTEIDDKYKVNTKPHAV